MESSINGEPPGSPPVLREAAWIEGIRPVLILLLLGLAILFGGGPNDVHAGERSPTIAQSVKEADLIIVGRVISLIDPKPAARARKPLEAHWVHVERTLKGIDESGLRLRARPNGLRWEDGESYVMFLKWQDIDWVEAVPQRLLQATKATIDAVAKEVAVQGAGVSPKRVVWMRHTGGWGAGVLAEFFVTVDGRFEWKKWLQDSPPDKPRYETRAGRLSQEVIASLIGQIARAGPGPIIDDAGIVTFRWLDAKGGAQFRTYMMPDGPPCADLLKMIESIARKYG